MQVKMLSLPLEDFALPSCSLLLLSLRLVQSVHPRELLCVCVHALMGLQEPPARWTTGEEEARLSSPGWKGSDGDGPGPRPQPSLPPAPPNSLLPLAGLGHSIPKGSGSGKRGTTGLSRVCGAHWDRSSGTFQREEGAPGWGWAPSLLTSPFLAVQLFSCARWTS